MWGHPFVFSGNWRTAIRNKILHKSKISLCRVVLGVHLKGYLTSFKRFSILNLQMEKKVIASLCDVSFCP